MFLSMLCLQNGLLCEIVCKLLLSLNLPNSQNYWWGLNCICINNIIQTNDHTFQHYQHNNVTLSSQGRSTISISMRTTSSLIWTRRMIMSPSCTTDHCPSTRMTASPRSPPPYHISMRSLARGWTSVLWTSPGSTACTTAVSISFHACLKVREWDNWISSCVRI